jgi:hypothetical protein
MAPGQPKEGQLVALPCRRRQSLFAKHDLLIEIALRLNDRNLVALKLQPLGSGAVLSTPMEPKNWLNQWCRGSSATADTKSTLSALSDGAESLDRGSFISGTLEGGPSTRSSASGAGRLRHW